MLKISLYYPIENAKTVCNPVCDDRLKTIVNVILKIETDSSGNADSVCITTKERIEPTRRVNTFREHFERIANKLK